MIKTLLTLLLTAMLAQAQTAEKFAELSASGRVFKNASITSVTASHATIRHDGGLAKVPIADLPESVQSKIGYDPEKAAAMTAEEKAKAEAMQKKLAGQKAALAQVASWRSEPLNLKVTAPTASGSFICSIEGEGIKDIRITGLPGSVTQYFTELKSINQKVAEAQEKLKRAQRAYEDIPYPIVSTNEFTGTWQIRDWQARSQQAKTNLRLAEDNLDSVEQIATRLNADEFNRTAFSARKTAQKYGKWEIWEYAGFPIERQTAEQP